MATVAFGFSEFPAGVTTKVFVPSCMDNHVGKAMWEDFLPEALRVGSFVPTPEPLITGKGLESLEGAINMQHKGISARKVVVLL